MSISIAPVNLNKNNMNNHIQALINAISFNIACIEEIDELLDQASRAAESVKKNLPPIHTFSIRVKNEIINYEENIRLNPLALLAGLVAMKETYKSSLDRLETELKAICRGEAATHND